MATQSILLYLQIMGLDGWESQSSSIEQNEKLLQKKISGITKNMRFDKKKVHIQFKDNSILIFSHEVSFQALVAISAIYQMCFSKFSESRLFLQGSMAIDTLSMSNKNLNWEEPAVINVKRIQESLTGFMVLLDDSIIKFVTESKKDNKEKEIFLTLFCSVEISGDEGSQVLHFLIWAFPQILKNILSYYRNCLDRLHGKSKKEKEAAINDLESFIPQFLNSGGMKDTVIGDLFEGEGLEDLIENWDLALHHAESMHLARSGMMTIDEVMEKRYKQQ